MYNLHSVIKIVKESGFEPIIDTKTPEYTHYYLNGKFLKQSYKLSKESILFFDDKHKETIKINIYKDYCEIGKTSRIFKEIWYIIINDLTSNNLKDYIDKLFFPSSFEELDSKRYKRINIEDVKEKHLIPIYNIIKGANLNAYFYNIKRRHFEWQEYSNWQAIIFEYYGQIYEILTLEDDNNELKSVAISYLGQEAAEEWGIFDEWEFKNKEEFSHWINTKEFLDWLNTELKINTPESIIDDLEKDLWNHCYYN